MKIWKYTRYNHGHIVDEIIPRTNSNTGELVRVVARVNLDDDARLIAAAPDLLAACEAALEMICAGAEGWMLDDVETRCRNAIAKARSE